jgi:hypothetical protein
MPIIVESENGTSLAESQDKALLPLTYMCFCNPKYLLNGEIQVAMADCMLELVPLVAITSMLTAR